MAKKKALNQTKKLTQLGSQKTQYPSTYSPGLLEAFPSPAPESEAWTSLVCTEFTSLCPMTAQPDFARIHINYIADKMMVESKSLKLYLFSFRNHGEFHENCIETITEDLFKLVKPHYIEVIGEFTPRGGITIFPYVQRSSKKKSYQDLLKSRKQNYSPGKYSLSLQRIYG